jgi:hypothetical protein
MKKVILVLLMLSSVTSFGQLKDFDKDGKRAKIAEEKITISVAAPPIKVAALSAATIGTALITTGVGFAKTALEKREASFTATYASNYTGERFFVSNSLQIGDVTILRQTKADGTAAFTTASKIVLETQQSTLGNVFRFKLKEVDLDYAKARIKKRGKTGKAVDISVTIQLTGLWNDYEFDEDHREKPAKVTIKSAVLGESTIILQNVKPGTPQTFNAANTDNYLYSDFFQMIPPTPIAPAIPAAAGAAAVPATPIAAELNRGWYVLKITVKEANPVGMNSNKLSNYLIANSESITNLLNAFIPAGKE